jgi:uncharacterized protein
LENRLLWRTFPNKIPTVTFDPVLDVEDARKEPDFFLQNHKTPLFLDEIQYAPESLAGRVMILNLFTMSYREISENVSHKSFLESYLFSSEISFREIPMNPPDLKKILWRGLFPGLLDKPDSIVPYYFDSYLKTYIERDIRVLSNLNSIQEFGSFFGILAGLSATEINPSELGRDLRIDRKTALRWLALAEQSFQWFSIPGFTRNPTKKVSQKKKGYFSDTGMICNLQKISSPESVFSNPLKRKVI